MEYCPICEVEAKFQHNVYGMDGRFETAWYECVGCGLEFTKRENIDKYLTDKWE